MSLVTEEPMEIAQRCLAGDPKAFREFVEHFERQVFALCLRMLGHRQDAEDTAQESLVRAVRYLGNWNPGQPLTPWVMKIAANRCRTALVKRAKLPVPAEDLGNQLTDSPSPPLGLGEELGRALATLSPNQRACFEMFYLHDLSVGQVADAMSVPEGTVKTWLHRSRKQLAEKLRERGVTPDSQ